MFGRKHITVLFCSLLALANAALFGNTPPPQENLRVQRQHHHLLRTTSTPDEGLRYFQDQVQAILTTAAVNNRTAIPEQCEIPDDDEPVDGFHIPRRLSAYEGTISTTIPGIFVITLSSTSLHAVEAGDVMRIEGPAALSNVGVIGLFKVAFVTPTQLVLATDADLLTVSLTDAPVSISHSTPEDIFQDTMIFYFDISIMHGSSVAFVDLSTLTVVLPDNSWVRIMATSDGIASSPGRAAEAAIGVYQLGSDIIPGVLGSLSLPHLGSPADDEDFGIVSLTVRASLASPSEIERLSIEGTAQCNINANSESHSCYFIHGLSSSSNPFSITIESQGDATNPNQPGDPEYSLLGEVFFSGLSEFPVPSPSSWTTTTTAWMYKPGVTSATPSNHIVTFVRPNP